LVAAIVLPNKDGGEFFLSFTASSTAPKASLECINVIQRYVLLIIYLDRVLIIFKSVLPLQIFIEVRNNAYHSFSLL
jgi:hypothetical protein